MPKRKYQGCTYPAWLDNKRTHRAWKRVFCPQGWHLWDEVWSLDSHYLYCDACGRELPIMSNTLDSGKTRLLAREGRLAHIRRVRRLAKLHGRCQEPTESGNCRYPHCQCLFGAEGIIDPETGKELIQEPPHEKT